MGPGSDLLYKASVFSTMPHTIPLLLSRPDSGLRLILSKVVMGSAAWEQGLRPGHTIIIVSGWMITFMRQPEVSWA